MAAQDRLSPRKQPRQARSRQTVEAILEAAAQVFAAEGYGGASTNAIAERAGVSVGSLYEYFPNKDSILVALAERHLEAMTTEVRRQVERTQATRQPLAAWLRELVAGLLAVHRAEPELHVVFAEAPHRPALHACILQAEEALAHAVEPQLRASPEVSVADCDTAAHLVVQTVEALTHRFVHHGIHSLSSERFVDEVVQLLCGYLRGAGR